MRINPILYGFIVLAVFFGIILGFQSAGIWTTSGKVNADGSQIQPLYDDVDTIKGWMTLDQITSTYNVTLEELLQKFGLPSDLPASTAIKDLESDTFDTTLLKEWLLTKNESPSGSSTMSETPAALPDETPNPIILVETTPQTTVHAPEDMTVTGSTTFQQLLDWGVPIEVIQNIIGETLPAPGMIIKDYAIGKGLQFSSVKTLLQTEVDKVK